MKKKLLDVLNSLFFLVKVIQFLCYTEIEKSDAINFLTWILVKKITMTLIVLRLQLSLVQCTISRFNVQFH